MNHEIKHTEIYCDKYVRLYTFKNIIANLETNHDLFIDTHDNEEFHLIHRKELLSGSKTPAVQVWMKVFFFANQPTLRVCVYDSCLSNMMVYVYDSLWENNGILEPKPPVRLSSFS